MAQTTYSYTISTDIPSAQVDINRLWDEISSSAIVIALQDITTNVADNLDVIFKDILSSTDKNILDGDTSQTPNSPTTAGSILGDHSGVALNAPQEVTTIPKARGPNDEQLVFTELPIGGGFRPVSHNFCDKCTWWHESTEHIDVACTDTGDQLTYDILTHDHLIDLIHERQPFENRVDITTVVPNGNTMTNLVPTVEDNAVPIAQSDEDATTGNDRYTIDYVAGQITFAVARVNAITISFRKAGTSLYTYVPSSGYNYLFEDAEVDFSENFDMTSAFRSRVYVSHSVDTGGAVVPYAPEDRIYNTFHDFQAAARRFFGPIPAGVGGTRGMQSPKWTFQWQYAYRDVLYPVDEANYVDLNIDPTEATLHKVELSTIGDVEWGSTDANPAVLTATFVGRKSKI